MRTADAVMAGFLVVGAWWGWPDSRTPDSPPTARSESALEAQRTPTPLPTRTAPDAYGRAAATAALVQAPSLEVQSDDHALVTFQLREHDGARPATGTVISPDCRLVFPITDGSFTVAVLPGTCTFNGQRPSGLLQHQTAPTTTTLQAGEHWFLDFTFPPGETGGIGAAINRHPRGVQLNQLLPGMPAEEAGLLPADIIATIDGDDTREMHEAEVIRRLTGPVDSLVTLTVWPGGEPAAPVMHTTIERRFLAVD